MRDNRCRDAAEDGGQGRGRAGARWGPASRRRRRDGNVGTGVVAVAGKANPAQLCQWLKRKISKDVKIFRRCPNGLRIVISRASRVGLRCSPAATCVALGLHPR
ncbi:uncharacterized protein LOC119336973 [Triticum dicoccoides]|uniref:uncharacterized protein LOC119336973 n=1 Tax=Triticum dicoccoides TaxID=85692 RepID=UPI0018912570|nr:uncharacterized protein LOC119336973 [Triticum dicoccoides]